MHVVSRSLVILLVACGALMGAERMAEAQDKRLERWVSVAGHGSVDAPADMARFTAGVASEAATAREALDANNTAMKRVLDGLKALGIPANDLQTARFHIEPRHQTYKDGRPAQVVGYRVSNDVRITIRNLARLGEVIDRAVTLGANQSGGLDFEVSDAEARKEEARRLAVANAMQRARVLAESAGARLGQVLTISEEAIMPGPRPMMQGRAAMASSVPIESGSEKLSVRVEMTFALQ